MLKEIFQISNYPNLPIYKTSVFDKIKLLFKIYLFIFLAIFTAAPLMLFVDYVIKSGLHFKGILHGDKPTLDKMFTKYGRNKALLVVCLIGPLLEECLFRLPLSLKKRSISLFFAGVIFMLIGVKVLSIALNFALILRLLITIVSFCVFYFFLAEKLIKVTHPFQKHIIIASIALFGLVHVGNFSPLQWPIIYLYPFFVIPQLIMGWGITYLRFKNGFTWGWLLHAMANSITILIFQAY